MLKKIILFSILFFINFSNVYSAQTIVFIDIDKIIQKSKSGTIVLNNLKKFQNQNNKKLQIKKEKLINDENEIKKLKNVLSEEDLNKKITVLKKNINEFNNEKLRLNEAFLNKKNELFIEYMKKINPMIEKYMDENSITLVLEKKNIFIANSKNDITDDIIKIIDQNE